MYLKNCARDSGVKSFFIIGRVHRNSNSLFICQSILRTTIPSGAEAEVRLNKNAGPLFR